MLIRIAAVVCLAAMLCSCGGVSSPSQNQSQTFTGTVANLSYGPVHTFSTSKVGEYFVTITALAPDQNIFLGINFGQPASGGCGVVQSNYQAHLNAQALGGNIEKGTWCVQVLDINGMVSTTTPTSYTLRVSYP
jgi:hypothetical protein